MTMSSCYIVLDHPACDFDFEDDDKIKVLYSKPKSFHKKCNINHDQKHINLLIHESYDSGSDDQSPEYMNYGSRYFKSGKKLRVLKVLYNDNNFYNDKKVIETELKTRYFPRGNHTNLHVTKYICSFPVM